MMSRALFERVGEFSTDYFMYSEDVDLCFKVREAGMRNYYVPSAVIVHHGGTSSAQTEVSTFSSVMLLESRWRFFLKTKPWGYGAVYRASIAAASLSRILIALAFWLTGLVTAERAKWKGALKKWNARLRWALGLEDWVKKY